MRRPDLRDASLAVLSTVSMLLLIAAARPAVADDPPPPTTPPTTDAAPAPAPERITDVMRLRAAELEPTVTTPLAKEFLAATASLAEPSARVIYRDRARGTAVSQRAYDAMPPEARASLTARECTPQFYYETGYGSPLVYVRVLDLVAPHLPRVERPRLLDFGYGTIGQLQLLAHCGVDAHGVDVEPVFEALYSEPGDVGPMGGGSVAIHTGQWPAEERLRTAVGGGYAAITSKNTLKKGYIHPMPPPGQTVDPSRLVHLGVSDEEFLKRVHDALVPGGVFAIYNICPPQNPPDQEYIPWADGLSPFPREAYESAGFEVIAFDAVDQAWVLDCFRRLGYLEGIAPEDAPKQFLCWYTIVRRRN